MGLIIPFSSASEAAESPASDASAVSVIIVNFNTRDQTLACVNSVVDTTDADRFDVIVVDNASSDGSLEAINGSGHRNVRAVSSGGNVGFAKAVNLGVSAASGDYVLLLNPDTISPPGALMGLLDFAKANPEYGVYGGRTVRSDGTLDPHSCWGAPTLWSTFCFGAGLSTAFAGSAVFDPESLGRWERDTIREVDVITGCLLLIRREDFLSIGGMDERYFLYGEDVEFSVRAKRNGLRPVFVSSVEIVHDSGGSSSASGGKMTMVMAGKVTLLRITWPKAKAELGVALLTAGTLLRAGLESLTRTAGRPWTTTWKRRSQWLPGYPEAETRIFGSSYSSA